MLYARSCLMSVRWSQPPALAQPELSPAMAVMENRAIVSLCQAETPCEFSRPKNASPVE